MKKKCRKTAVLLLAIAFICSLGACSDDREVEEFGNKETNTMSSVQTSNKEDEKTEGVNPLGISQSLYEYCDEKILVDTADNVKLLATCASDTEEDGGSVLRIQVYNYDKKSILVEYESIKQKGNETVNEKHLALYDKTKGSMIKEFVFENLDSVFIERKSDSISIDTIEDDIWTTRTYDFELNPIGEMKYEYGVVPGDKTYDGKRFYYSKNRKLYVYDSELDVNAEFESENKFLVESVCYVITDENGNDYVIFYGMAADYNNYYFIYDVANCNVIRADEDGYDVFGNNLCIHKRAESGNENDIGRYIIGSAKDKAFEYQANNNGMGVAVFSLDNGDILFTYSENDSVYLYVYNKKTAELKASTVLDASRFRRELNIDITEEEQECYSTKINLYTAPISVDENTLLLELTDFFGTTYYLEWKLEKVADNGMMNVAAHTMGSVKGVDISSFKNDLLSPGKLSDSLKPLKEKADKMEEKYGIDIYIGEECRDISGSYLIYPLTDYSAVNEALEALDAELRKYPDNFFNNFKTETIKGIDVHIASELMGISDIVLGSAGGFKVIEDGAYKLVINCTDSSNIMSTFHHELSHAIDEILLGFFINDEDPLFSEEKWNALNPYQDMYSENYEDYGKEEYWNYSYETISAIDEDNIKDSYFVDVYGMTYPTEDRARIFESVMSDNVFDINFDETPHLKEKLNYYAKCIRAAFDSKDWKDVPWEEYME